MSEYAGELIMREKKGILIVVSGFSGAGKGTLMKKLMQDYDNYALSISATTRQPRVGEEDGREYFFRTKEEFEKVRKMLDSKSFSVNNRGRRGKHKANDVWCRKLKCYCGASMNRRVWRRINGIPQYCYQCYSQVRTGSIATRKKKGLDLEGICDTPMVPGWKLGAMADIIFQKFWQDRNGIIEIANEMLEEHFKDDRDIDFQSEIEETQRKIAIIDKKFDNLVDMRMAGEIDKAKFDEKKKSLFEEKEKWQKMLQSYQIDEEVSDEEYDQRLQVLKYGLEQNFNFSTHSIPEEVIDAFVKEIIVYPDCFVWKLNIVDDDLKLQVEGRKNDPTVSLIESPTTGNDSTGSNRKQINHMRYF